MSRWKQIIIALSALTFVGRIFITPRLVHIPSPELSYEAFAHLLCGGLIAVHLYDRSQRLYGYLGWGMALWELGWFAVQKALA